MDTIIFDFFNFDFLFSGYQNELFLISGLSNIIDNKIGKREQNGKHKREIK